MPDTRSPTAPPVAALEGHEGAGAASHEAATAASPPPASPSLHECITADSNSRVSTVNECHSDAGAASYESAAAAAPSPASPSLRERITAGFSLRVATVNVCVFPLATRNKYAVSQLAVGLLTGIVGIACMLRLYAPWLPLLLHFPLALLITLPLLSPIIVAEAAVLFVSDSSGGSHSGDELLTRGGWHDHKLARLRLLLRSLDQFDCVALQELFSSTIDARYRDLVLREAALQGFHYSVPISRFPQFPALMLNAGTLILSRYAIQAHRTLVFRTRASFDTLIVNRGASWARIELPTGHRVHLFTVHVAPPINEVSERVRGGSGVGRIIDSVLPRSLFACAQQAQLDELIDFIKECIEPDRKEWEASCELHRQRTASSPSDSPTGSAPPPSCPFSVVVAGDFNLDCGSLRYFKLVHQLHELGLGIKDLFAAEHPAHQQQAAACAMHEEGEEGEEEEEEEEAARDGAPRKRRGDTSTGAASVRSNSSSSAAPSSSARMCVTPNLWTSQCGNGREHFDASAHSHLSPVIRSPSLTWEPTFGQVLMHPDVAATSSPSSPSPSPPALPACPSPCHRHQETFLTHPSLLGSQTTHDYIFSSMVPRHTRVEPFLAPHAKRRLHVEEGGTHSQRRNAHATEHGRERTYAHEGAHDATRYPPYTQLSDHCALIATLMMPDESAARSRADSTA